MTNIELKQALYEVFKRHRSSMTSTFKDGLNQYYISPDPDAYINRIKYYVGLFDNGQGDERYTDFINDVKIVLNQNEKSVVSEQPENEKVVIDKTSEVEDIKSNSEAKKVDVKQVNAQSEQQSKTNLKSEKTSVKVKTEPKKTVFDVSDNEIKLTKAKPKPDNSQRVVMRSKRTGKHNIIDMTTKMIRLNLSNGLITLLDEHISEAAKSYLLSSGVLSEEEALHFSQYNSTSTYRDHDFQLTRNDIFTILVLLGLTHLNVDIKDEAVEELFDYNDVKYDFYQQLVNSNLVELDVQSRVRQLQQKLEKSVNQNERIETMLGFLLLERANVPKNQNREKIKQVLDTSSVMNQAPDSFSVLDGIVGSKLSSIKDYKRARGE